MDYGYNIFTTQDEKYDLVIKIAQGDYRFENIVDWIIAKIK